MFQYYQDILCVNGGFLYKEAGLISKSYYDAMCRRNQINVVRRGGNGRSALIEYYTLPEKVKGMVQEIYGDPQKQLNAKQFIDRIKYNAEAAEFYAGYRLQDGRNLPLDTQKEYRANVSVMEACLDMVSHMTGMRKKLGGSVRGIWKSVSDQVNDLPHNQYPHTLPTNYRRLKQKCIQYKEQGYVAVIHRGFCNDNSRKVTGDLEALILSLYCMKEKPYITVVVDMYMDFVQGRITDIVNVKTGELLNSDDFCKDGKPIMITDSTVWNYVNDPKNKIIISKHTASSLEYNTKYRPHHHRHKPTYSLSKISLDDRDLPRKTHDGKRVKAYYAYDVASGCVIGAAYSMKKDTNLFLECMRDMFRTLHDNKLGIPMEVEVEHHLVNQFKDDMMAAGNLFPMVRWCNPGNSQEKHAEHFNKEKKYGYEKRYQEGIGRWYAKHERNRPKIDKTWDEDGMKTIEKSYGYDQLVAEDLEAIKKYNNSLHRAQKTHKGMTKWDVLLHNVNPNLSNLDEYLIARYVGDRTTTSIVRSQYVRVQYAKYQLPSPHLLSKLKPNNYTVDAYYLPNKKGIIERVHLYQDGIYICECDKIETYNTARAEQTATDVKSYRDQSSYVKAFDGMVKSERMDKISTVKEISINNENHSFSQPEPVIPVGVSPDSPSEDNGEFIEEDHHYNDPEYWVKKAFEEL